MSCDISCAKNHLRMCYLRLCHKNDSTELYRIRYHEAHWLRPTANGLFSSTQILWQRYTKMFRFKWNQIHFIWKLLFVSFIFIFALMFQMQRKTIFYFFNHSTNTKYHTDFIIICVFEWERRIRNCCHCTNVRIQKENLFSFHNFAI